MEKENLEKSSLPTEIDLLNLASREVYPHSLHATGSLDPDIVLKDLFLAEKEIANETLNALRLRHEKERGHWENLFAQKENEILTLKTRVSESEDKIKKLDEMLKAEQSIALEQVRMSAHELEAQKIVDKKKWEHITDELKSFNEYALNSQKKFLAEQERLRNTKKFFNAQIESMSEQLKKKDEELMASQERLAKKEEALINEQAKANESRAAADEEIKELKKLLDNERDDFNKTIERAETRLAQVEKSYKDALLDIESKLRRESELEKAIQEMQQQIQKERNENQKARQNEEARYFELKKAHAEEQIQWEKLKRDMVDRENAFKKESQEHLNRALKSAEILEQQLTEEQRLLKEADALNAAKTQEIERLVNQRNEVVKEWRNAFADEQENFKRQKNDMLNESNKILRFKDEEITRLGIEISGLQAVVSEANKSLGLMKSENSNLNSRINMLEEEKIKAGEIAALKEKDFQEHLLKEQEFTKQRIHEVQITFENKIKYREEEISRLNEEINKINADIVHLNSQLILEKSEVEKRNNKIQQLELKIEEINEKHKQEKENLAFEIMKLKNTIEKNNEAVQARESELLEQVKYLKKINSENQK